ncbi:S8 family serine peptidase [Heliorestis acidaminivorans]|uniref:S8 family serine peptidase n=1 Tax=Heliorestis acidaminivorans TaxID=553427 RepID=A0A6I0ET35_9FIRM|nr:S8 family serine peptidase [Heliorestis acidaminivorans]KAB2953785.1 S8 family serine peptidase [Heliorestis acidaminivorans]
MKRTIPTLRSNHQEGPATYLPILLLMVLCMAGLLISLPANSNTAYSYEAQIEQPHQEIELLSDRARDIVGATPVSLPGLITAKGLTGEGQIVALADSGLDSGQLSDLHPDFHSEEGKMPKVIQLQSWAGRDRADDTNGHGTHMAGIIAGTGSASKGQYKGLAPGASLYIQGLLNEEGVLRTPANLEQLFYPAYSAGARIHVNGWGGRGNYYGVTTAQIDDFIRQNPDFLVIFGAGNSGPERGTITTESNSKNALVIGASQSPRPGFDSTLLPLGSAVELSSRGPTADGRIKPELLAPGTSIVAPRSRYIESNFPAHEEYTRMQGTSMASAVAGGAVALLRQYLMTTSNQGPQSGPKESPSSALIKALLINGARTNEAGPSLEGFGTIDLASTILALQDKSFFYRDEHKGLQEDEEAIYRYSVYNSTEPLKITLAWTDPAAEAGTSTSNTLVNDLDLLVIAPDGQEFMGNHFLGSNDFDRLNNVEQVYIAEPQYGTYQIIVRASTVAEKASQSTQSTGQVAQDYALVYGQLPLQGIVTGQGRGAIPSEEPFFSLSQESQPEDEDEISAAQKETITYLHLDNGKKVPWKAYQSLYVENEAIKNLEIEGLPYGADLYQTNLRTYLISRIWHTGAVQAVIDGEQAMILEMSSAVREGGYYLSPQIALTVNGEKQETLQSLLPGSEIRAIVNPSTQTIWQADSTYIEKEGIVERANQGENQLRLLRDSTIYRGSPQLAVTFEDAPVGKVWRDMPFHSTTNFQELLPGMAVRLVQSPQTGQIHHLAIRRQSIQGTIESIDPNSKRLTFVEGGDTYQLLEGSQVHRDDEEAVIEDLQVGDYITAMVLPDSQSLVDIRAYSQIRWGRVVYHNNQQKQLYLVNQHNRLEQYTLAPDLQVYRWGMPADLVTVPLGTWTWLTLNSTGQQVKRIDSIEVAEEREEIFANYRSSDHSLITLSGRSYQLSPRTVILKNGYLIEPTDLVVGETIELTTLMAPPPTEEIVAMVQGKSREAFTAPYLQIQSFFQLQNRLFVTGQTSATKLYAYYQSGTVREKVTVDSQGRFVWYFDYPAGEKEIQLVAMAATGAITGQKVSIPTTQASTLQDIKGHWAEESLQRLSLKGIITGNEDRYFRPDEAINRLEFALLLSRALGWPQEEEVSAILATIEDHDAIPLWAQHAVAQSWQREIFHNSEHNFFFPQQEVQQGEGWSILSRLPNQPFPFPEKWGEEGYRPFEPLTRAQSIILIEQLLHHLAEQDIKVD